MNSPDHHGGKRRMTAILTVLIISLLINKPINNLSVQDVAITSHFKTNKTKLLGSL